MYIRTQRWTEGTEREREREKGESEVVKGPKDTTPF